MEKFKEDSDEGTENRLFVGVIYFFTMTVGGYIFMN